MQVLVTSSFFYHFLYLCLFIWSVFFVGRVVFVTFLCNNLSKHHHHNSVKIVLFKIMLGINIKADGAGGKRAVGSKLDIYSGVATTIPLSTSNFQNPQVHSMTLDSSNMTSNTAVTKFLFVHMRIISYLNM